MFRFHGKNTYWNWALLSPAKAAETKSPTKSDSSDMHLETGSIVSCDICPQVRLEVNPNESAAWIEMDVASRGVETTLKDRHNNSRIVHRSNPTS